MCRTFCARNQKRLVKIDTVNNTGAVNGPFQLPRQRNFNMTQFISLFSVALFSIVCASTSIGGVKSVTHERPSLDLLQSPGSIFSEISQDQKVISDLQKSLSEGFTIQSSDTRLEIVIDKAARGKSAQTMWVKLDGKLIHTWKVSTGREQNEEPPDGNDYFSGTPTGKWRPFLLKKLHRSKKWETDMPFAIFFIGGIAIHAAPPGSEGKLGRRASGGCIRVLRSNAEKLFKLVEEVGKEKTLIRVVNSQSDFEFNSIGRF